MKAQGTPMTVIVLVVAVLVAAAVSIGFMITSFSKASKDTDTNFNTAGGISSSTSGTLGSLSIASYCGALCDKAQATAASFSDKSKFCDDIFVVNKLEFCNPEKDCYGYYSSKGGCLVTFKDKTTATLYCSGAETRC